MDGCTFVSTYVGKISPFYRTSSPIGAAALLPKGRSRPIKRSRATGFSLLDIKAAKLEHHRLLVLNWGTAILSICNFLN